MVSALSRKLLRDLRRLSGQVVTIGLVVAAGVATYVAMQSTYRSLQYSQDHYYERYRFADVFARAERVPDALLPRLESLPGAASVHTRVLESVTLPLDDVPEPATGQIVSLPEDDRPPLGDVYLRRGRLPEPGHGNETLVLEAFADEHGIEPGDHVPAVINGTLRELRVVGVALSPEYVFAMQPGSLTYDPARFAVLWMPRPSVAAAFDMDGAFNDVLVRLQPGASEAETIQSLDRLLEPYGGLGAHGRDRQVSHHFLKNELAQLDVQATIIPAIFLAVAAFLVNVVLARLVQLQRSQIAALKALGYDDRAIGLHYLELVSVVVLLGSVVGTGVGAWLGAELVEVYEPYFRFPALVHQVDWDVVAVAVSISLLAAVVGAAITVRQVARLPPAEAMRPPAPALYRPILLDRLGLSKLLGQSARMVIRELERRPLRLLLSCLGIAMAVAILVVGRFFYDSIEYLMDTHFQLAMQDDLEVGFRTPQPERSVRSLDHLSGVLHAEGMRTVPVRMRSGHHQRETVLFGYPEDGRLRVLLNEDAERIPLPVDGVVLTAKLAEVLDVEPGDDVEVTRREGNRTTHRVRVANLAQEMFGMQGHMRRSAMERALGEPPLASSALLSVDPRHMDDVRERLKEIPAVASVERKEAATEAFREQSAEMILAFTFVLAVFASVIAVGVVYNNARVALSMRSRDLASLRVIGFTRGEISGILLGELGVQVLLAIPLGMWIGTWAAAWVSSIVDPENFRIPPIISSRTYAFAAVIAIGSGLVSALLVRRRLDHLDLIGVLKTRE
ncbi:MAG: ABC transporter permease [Myxococcota bacterium]